MIAQFLFRYECCAEPCDLLEPVESLSRDEVLRVLATFDKLCGPIDLDQLIVDTWRTRPDGSIEFRIEDLSIGHPFLRDFIVGTVSPVQVH